MAAGTWVQEYAPARFVLWFSRIRASDAAAPDVDSGAAAWARFLSSLLVAPACLLAVGTVLALGIPAVLWCSRPCSAKRRRGGIALWAVACSALSVLVLVSVGLGLSVSQGMRMLDSLSADLERGENVLRSATVELEAMNATSALILEEMRTASTPCPRTFKATLDHYFGQASAVAGRYARDIAMYHELIVGMPPQVAEVRAVSEEFERWAPLCLAGPMVLIALTCLMVCLDVMTSRCRKRRCPARLTGCGMSLTPLLMFLAFLATSCELALGVAGSAVCLDVDAEVLRQARAAFGSDSRMFRFTQYYVAGKGENPGLQKLDDIEEGVTSSIAAVRAAEHSILLKCPGWRSKPFFDAMQGAYMSLNRYKRFLAPETIYPLYDLAVHDHICGGAMDALGIAVTAQVFLCLVCLPILTVAGGRAISVEHRNVTEDSIGHACNDECRPAVLPTLLTARHVGGVRVADAGEKMQHSRTPDGSHCTRAAGAPKLGARPEFSRDDAEGLPAPLCGAAMGEPAPGLQLSGDAASSSSSPADAETAREPEEEAHNDHSPQTSTTLVLQRRWRPVPLLTDECGQGDNAEDLSTREGGGRSWSRSSGSGLSPAAPWATTPAEVAAVGTEANPGSRRGGIERSGGSLPSTGRSSTTRRDGLLGNPEEEPTDPTDIAGHKYLVPRCSSPGLPVTGATTIGGGAVPH